jgi:hypothetical protein
MTNSTSCSQIAKSYDLGSATRVDAALRELRDYRKLWSACLMQSVGLEPPASIIVTRDIENATLVVGAFGSRIGVTDFLLRHDKIGETPDSPRGGFIVSQRQLPTVLERFFVQGRIVAVYEPLDPMRNGYNISVVFYGEGEGVAEVVGPGFDASDLQRGDISPHESFAVHLHESGTASVGVRQMQCVSTSRYAESAAQRRLKLKKKAAEVEAAFGVRAPSNTFAHIPSTYCPIDPSVVKGTVGAIVASGVIDRFRSSTRVGYPLTIASSFVSSVRQIYWDITSAALKYEGMI